MRGFSSAAISKDLQRDNGLASTSFHGPPGPDHIAS
jgi:hypothetical protein